MKRPIRLTEFTVSVFRLMLRAIPPVLLCSLILSGMLASAQDDSQSKPATDTTTASKPAAEGDTEALAKAAQNPVASMISVPLQNNTAFGVGPYNRTQDVLNIQPVIPISISENWNLIARIIQPIVWQPNVSQTSQGWFGLGDMKSHVLLLASEAKQIDLGGRANLRSPHGYRRSAWPGKVQHGAGSRFVDHAGEMGHWHLDQ